MLLRCLGQAIGNTDEGKPSKIQRILMKLPLKLTINDNMGNFELITTRSNTTQYLYSMISHKRSLLHFGSTAIPLAAGFDNVGNYGVRYGSVLDNRIRHQFQLQDAMGSDEYQIFVKRLDLAADRMTPDEIAHALTVIGFPGDFESVTQSLVTLRVKASFTILMVKEMVTDLFDIPVAEQRLIFASKQLEDGRILTCLFLIYLS